MGEVWGVWVNNDEYRQRRTCHENGRLGACRSMMTKVRGREFRWWHNCAGLKHDGIRVVYSGLVWGNWFSSFSLKALDDFADELSRKKQSVAQSTVAESDDAGGILIQLDDHRPGAITPVLQATGAEAL